MLTELEIPKLEEEDLTQHQLEEIYQTQQEGQIPLQLLEEIYRIPQGEGLIPHQPGETDQIRHKEQMPHQ